MSLFFVFVWVNLMPLSCLSRISARTPDVIRRFGLPVCSMEVCFPAVSLADMGQSKSLSSDDTENSEWQEKPLSNVWGWEKKNLRQRAGMQKK